MVSTFSRRSVTAEAMDWWLTWNSSDLGLILLWSIVMLCHPSLGGTGLEGCRSENRYEHIHVRFSPAIHGLRNFRNDSHPAPGRTLGAGFRVSLLVQEQFATDQHPPDFRRSSPDLIQLRVPQQSAGGVVVDVAVAAEELDGVEGEFGGHFG